MVSSALNEAERNSIVRMFGPNCNVKSTAMVRLYVTPPNGIVWKFTNIIGVLAVMTDNNMKGHFLRIVDIKNMKITFEQEIYEFFEYHNPRAWFHTFESDNVVHAFSFANEPEAKLTFDGVKSIVSTINGPNASPARPRTATTPQFVSQTSLGNLNIAPTPAHAITPTPTPTLTPTPTPAPTPSPITDTSDKKKKDKKKKKHSKKKKEEHVLEISGPTDFKHESHIGWDAQKGFEIRNIPPEWKKLFQQAGIRKSELRDKETASMLMSIVGAQLGQPTAAPPSAFPTHGPPGLPSGPPPGPPQANRASVVRSSSDVAMGRPPPGPPAGVSMSRMPPPPPGGASAPPPPPPPPASGPPPPPMMPKSSSSPSLPTTDSRSDLLSAIRGGTQLRKVDEALPDISTLPESESKSIVDTLALAIQARRQNIREEEDEDDDYEDEDDEWSD